MKTLKLKDILDRFDEEFLVFTDPDIVDGFKKDEMKAFIKKSIKDALEAVKVDDLPSDFECDINDIDCQKEKTHIKGWNANTTQYDENVNKFLEENEK